MYEEIIEWFTNTQQSYYFFGILLIATLAVVFFVGVNLIKIHHLKRKLQVCEKYLNEDPDEAVYQMSKLFYLKKIIGQYIRFYFIDKIDMDELIYSDPGKLNILHSILKNTINPYIEEYLVLKKLNEGYLVKN